MMVKEYIDLLTFYIRYMEFQLGEEQSTSNLLQITKAVQFYSKGKLNIMCTGLFKSQHNCQETIHCGNLYRTKHFYINLMARNQPLKKNNVFLKNKLKLIWVRGSQNRRGAPLKGLNPPTLDMELLVICTILFIADEEWLEKQKYISA